jgi:hypothetical protein
MIPQSLRFVPITLPATPLNGNVAEALVILVYEQSPLNPLPAHFSHGHIIELIAVECTPDRGVTR